MINLVEHAHRPGTKQLYKSRWAAWCKWCVVNKVDPSAPQEIELANYLASLSHLSASAVKGHRAAISTTLKQMGRPSFSDDPLLKDVVQGKSLKEARSPKRFPAWDIFPVLKALRLHPFEPIDNCELRFLSFKTAFLTALASGRRCSAIHALAFRGVATEPDGAISLRFIPEFLAKNQPVGVQAKPIVIKSLASVLCNDDEDITLCPVRALKTYLRRTQFLRTPAKRRLFVSFREDKRSDISSPTISRWIKSVIRIAYSTSTVDKEPGSLRAHEVRAWAASLAWANNTSMTAILEAGYWFSQATFLQYYLRDVSHVKMDGSRSISFVAAQQAITSESYDHKKSSSGGKHSSKKYHSKRHSNKS